MNRHTLSLALGLLACLAAPLTGLSQKDSSMAQFPKGNDAYYDLGYLRLDKTFTQAIIIKGSDLETMPFANLSDVIGAWTYGAYSGRATLLYLVDGLPVGDVNAYSVYDIDEIVLVENASALVNTGATQQEVVLIKTKRGKGRGMTAAGQTGLVNSDTGSLHSRMRSYQNFYAGGWLNTGKWNMRLSGNYQHDAWPLAQGTTVTPFNLQRWRLYGTIAFRPNRRNEIEAGVNFVPQRTEYEADSVWHGAANDGWMKGTQAYVLPRLRWRSEWWSGWSNELQGSYVSSVYHQRSLSDSRDTGGVWDSKVFNYDTVKTSEVIVRDGLRYTAVAGDWRISPGFTVIYQYQNYRVGAAQLDSYYSTGNSPYLNGSWSAEWGKGHFFTLTPAVDISYREMLDLQAGILRYDQPHLAPGEKQDFPFVSGTLDILRAANAGGSNTLRVYGSYAKRLWNAAGVSAFEGLGSLADLSSGPVFSVPSSATASLGWYPGGTYYFNPSRVDTVAYWAWETGVGFTGAGGRIKLDYTFERRKIYKQEIIPVSYYLGPAYTVAYPSGPSELHHLSVQVVAGRGEKWEWRSAAQVTLLRSKLNPSSMRPYETDVVGDKSPDALSWTGGWVNRFRAGRLTAGLDLLWHSGENLIQLNAYRVYPTDTVTVNSVFLPQVYVAYRIPLRREGSIEFFAESRGVIRSKRQDLADDRRYYTLGAKMDL
jgi:hypothetical protein